MFMTEVLGINPEKESMLGLSTLELVQRVVEGNNDIQVLNLRPYTRPAVNEEIFPVQRNIFLNFNLDFISKWARAMGDGYNVALDSNVELADGSEKHFGMIDLSIPVSDSNLETVKLKFREFIVPRFGGGFLLKSGASYHFLADRLLTKEEWPSFLGTALLTPLITKNAEGINVIERRVVDDLYIGHSLVRGESGLRLTTNSRKPAPPLVVGYV